MSGCKKKILPSIEGSAVEISLIFWDRNELVDQRFLLDEVVSPLVIIGVLELVGLLPVEGLESDKFNFNIKFNLTVITL